ncbi:hypothetical protein JOM56_005336 [Amanita muscaria]
MTLLTLPHELVERILLLLPAESVQTCRLVNRALNETIQSSALLQYFQACEAAGVIDNPQSPLSYPERLEALKKREKAWRKLKPVFEMTISVNDQTASSQICRSTEGFFFLTDDNRKDLNCCHLTSFPQDNPRWTRIPGHGPALDWSGILVNFAAALHEHDLIVNFISYAYLTFQSSRQRHSLDFVLLRFSTGEYHPLAHRPRIHVQRSPEAEPWVDSKIVGDNLALLVHTRRLPLDEGTFSDKLFIFNWKTGRKLLQHEAAEDAYSTLDFVSPELLIVPNRALSHFEVWHLPPYQLNPKPPIQILSLQIPAVSPPNILSRFDCYGDPRLPIHSMPYLSPRPFFSSPENSIFITKVGTWSILGHRPSSVSSGLSTNLSTSRCTFLRVPWAKWGPPISRWFQLDAETRESWFGHSNGQRCISSKSNPRDWRKLIVSVADFNAHNFRRSLEMSRLRSGEGENNSSNGDDEGEEEESEILDHEGVFSEKVFMGLKCVVHYASGVYDFGAVLMDEQRLFGMKLNDEGWKSVSVFYIG